MADSELQSLRRKHRRICANLAKLEPLAAGYYAKLAAVEAAIHALDPQLWLPPRRYEPNSVFARQELPQLTMTISRKADGPLAVREIARLALATKSVRYPGPRVWKTTRVRLQQFLGKLGARGVTRKVGSGNGTRRVLI
jgi:hypothetical protein